MLKEFKLAACVIAFGAFALWGLSAQPPARATAATTPHGAAQAQGTALKPLYQMSQSEINQFLATLKGQNLVQRIEKVSERAKGTPYLLGPLGEGASAPYDKDPLMDLSKVDCVTFCEQTLALALSATYAQAFETLQKIRYKNGERKMECRNHYTMADWVPNNAWLLHDITASLPGHAWLTRTISHQKLFASQHLKGIQVREPDRTLKQAYIPEDHLLAIQKDLHSGDMAILIMDHEGIFAAHTGLMIRLPNGQLVFRNATSLEPKQVVDTPFDTLVTSLKKSKRLIGMAFARPRNDLHPPLKTAVRRPLTAADGSAK